MKKAAVYNRWLHRMGGGEQYAASLAIVLNSLGYKTEFLTHQYVDMKKLQQKLDVNLSHISIRYLSNEIDKKLGKYTKEYDVFVNTSFMDYIPNESSCGILSVFFPTHIKLSMSSYVKILVVSILRKILIYPSLFNDLDDVFIDGKTYKAIGQNSQVYCNVSDAQDLKLKLYIYALSSKDLDSFEFSIDGKPLLWKSRKVHVKNNMIEYSFHHPKGFNQHGIKIRVIEPASYGNAYLASVSFPGVSNFVYRIFKFLFPRLEVRLHGGETITTRKDLESYQEIIAISSFTQSWITKLWNLKSTILYPPVHIKEFKQVKQKELMIISVGRFFVGGHSKKQLEMVQMFKKIYDLGYKDWKLVLLGRVAEGSIHSEYVEKVKHEAKGYPIEIITDVSSDELKEKLSKAKIYWHATGLHEDEEKDPINMEHFGITIVEAMASGCVPIVINKGGQKEVVDSTCGFLWNTEDEWLEKTIQVMKDDHLCKQLQTKALEKSKQFSDDMFSKRFTEILSKHIQVK